MERGDLLRDNGAIFSKQGKALNANADRNNLKVIVVGNPANTNAWIAAQNAPDIPVSSFSAMTRLDHNRGLAQLSDKLNVPVDDIHNFCIWGNHSSTQYPDISHAKLADGKKVADLADAEWVKSNFIPTVQKRGAAIIAARGASSAASAAAAAVDHIRDWHLGTGNRWTSMAIASDGSYGTEKGVFYSFPVTINNGKVSIVQGLPINDVSRKLMDATNEELKTERDDVRKLLNL
jgi:malate dehydrogenase